LYTPGQDGFLCASKFANHDPFKIGLGLLANSGLSRETTPFVIASLGYQSHGWSQQCLALVVTQAGLKHRRGHAITSSIPLSRTSIYAGKDVFLGRLSGG
jgi:hypothetical protein